MKKILFFVLFPFSAIGQWSTFSTINTKVCNASGNQEDVRIIPDGSGGSIITWMDSRPTGNTDIFAQRLDSSGIAQWTANGVAICTEASDQSVPVIAEDGNGGAIIVWRDMRNGNSDIFAQRINNQGTVQWTPNGVAVDTKTGPQIDPKVVSDGANGAIILWQDSVSGNWDIYAQRINGLGTKMWSAAGAVVCSAANDQKNPKIISNSAGESIIAWQDKRNGSNYDIYTQKINANGTMAWAVNGVGICSSSDTQNNPKIESDGAGGAIIAWTDKRNGADYNVYAQRVDGSGASQWTANGVIICGELNNQSAIDMATANISGAIITWKDYRNNIYADIYAQYVDLSGVVQWPVNGVSISKKSFDQINPNIVTDGSGAYIVWQDSSTGTWDVYAQKVLLNGTVQWGNDGKIIGNAASSQSGPKNIIDGKGGTIVAWQDNRDTLSKLDVYAQRINSDGSLGSLGLKKIKAAESIARIFPNPNEGKFRIQSSLQNSLLEIYTITGMKIYSSRMDSEMIDLSVQPEGIYFYKISSSTSIQSGKIIIR